MSAKHDDYLDAVLYGLEAFSRFNIKEDNKMNIPGGMKDNLKRIFGAADPLNHIENMVVTHGYNGIEVNLTLRIPRGCERFAMSSPLFCGHLVSPFFDVDDGCVAERELVSSKPNEFVKPRRVFFNGEHTVIEWPDGEKTTVGLCPGESYDEYTGFCAAIVKKLFGSSREAKKFMDSIKVVQKKKDKKKTKRGDE